MDSGLVQAAGEVVVFGQFDFFVETVDFVKHRFFEDDGPAGDQGLGSVLGDIHADVGEGGDKSVGIAAGVRFHPGGEEPAGGLGFGEVVVDFT